jgi:hypothetical protein
LAYPDLTLKAIRKDALTRLSHAPEVRDFLHQNEMLAYCDARLRQTPDGIDPGLKHTVDYYLGLDNNKLEKMIESFPAVRELQQVIDYFESGHRTLVP